MRHRETETFYVAAPGSGTLAGTLRQYGTFALIASVGAAPLAFGMSVTATPAPLRNGALLLGYVVFLAVAWWFVGARTRVDIGADGMRLSRLGRSRFYPAAALLGTNTSPREVTVFLDEALVGQRELSLVSRTRVARDPSLPYDDDPDPELVALADRLASCIDRDASKQMLITREHA